MLFDTLTKGSADSFALRNHGMKAMLPGVFPERAFSTNYALKDLSYAIQMAEERGVPALGADVARELMERAKELGYEQGILAGPDQGDRGRHEEIALRWERGTPVPLMMRLWRDALPAMNGYFDSGGSGDGGCCDGGWWLWRLGLRLHRHLLVTLGAHAEGGEPVLVKKRSSSARICHIRLLRSAPAPASPKPHGIEGIVAVRLDLRGAAACGHVGRHHLLGRARLVPAHRRAARRDGQHQQERHNVDASG